MKFLGDLDTFVGFVTLGFYVKFIVKNSLRLTVGEFMNRQLCADVNTSKYLKDQ